MHRERKEKKKKVGARDTYHCLHLEDAPRLCHFVKGVVERFEQNEYLGWFPDRAPRREAGNVGEEDCRFRKEIGNRLAGIDQIVHFGPGPRVHIAIGNHILQLGLGGGLAGLFILPGQLSLLLGFFKEAAAYIGGEE
jgi:hypothetical protein